MFATDAQIKRLAEAVMQRFSDYDDSDCEHCQERWSKGADGSYVWFHKPNCVVILAKELHPESDLCNDHLVKND